MALPHLLPSMLSRFHKTGKVDYSALMRTCSLGVEVLSNICTWHWSRTWNPLSFHTLFHIGLPWYFYLHLSQRQLGSDHTSMDRTHPETISETFGNEATSEGQMVKAMVLPSTIMMAIGGIMMRCGGRTNWTTFIGETEVQHGSSEYQTSFWECRYPKQSLTKSRSTLFSCWDIGNTWHLLC